MRALVFSGVLFCCPAFCSAAGAALPLEDCRLQGEVGSVAARCGYLAVPENRAVEGGRRLQLHVAVIPALRLQPEGDPLIVLSGGPGQAASDFYLSVSPAFARIRRERDIVIVDQRGTGRSNRLDCEFPDDDLTLVDPTRLRAITRECLDGLAGDARHYTTSIAVLDLDAVRAALGYERVNLYGVSYGTRVAQHYMRRYPHRVRTAILDGVVPAELGLGPDVAIEAQRALDTLLSRCAADSACAEHFPDVRQQFAALRARLSAAPLDVSLAHPVTARSTTTTLGAANLSAAVRLLTYSDESASTLPLLLHLAQTENEPQALAAQYLMIKESMDAQMAYGMHFSVVCSEDAPRWDAQPVTSQQLEHTYMGGVFMQGLRTACEVWPRGPVDPDFGEPLRSAVPTLILSGGNDPVTPARYGEQILPGFTRARHLILPGQGHGQLAIGCMPFVTAQFIQQGDVAALALECLGSVAPAPFMLSRSGAAP